MGLEGVGGVGAAGENIERQPEIPARWPIFIGEFALGLHIEIALSATGTFSTRCGIRSWRRGGSGTSGGTKAGHSQIDGKC
jgi:hypothetical protein